VIVESPRALLAVLTRLIIPMVPVRTVDMPVHHHQNDACLPLVTPRTEHGREVVGRSISARSPRCFGRQPSCFCAFWMSGARRVGDGCVHSSLQLRALAHAGPVRGGGPCPGNLLGLGLPARSAILTPARRASRWFPSSCTIHQGTNLLEHKP
jgi:hypothetical protein